jgi:hypothetical protein
MDDGTIGSWKESGVAGTARLVLGGALVLALACGTVHGQIALLGAMGDSLTDEYFEDSFSYAQNWTIQLVQYRGVSMGPTAAQAGQPGGTWGEPRRTGYQCNWARYGDASSDLLADGQPAGLAGQVSSLGVSHGVLMIGANDFNPTTVLGAYFEIYNSLWSSSQTTTYINGTVANIRSALDTVAPTGVQMVLVNVLDFGITPLTQSLYPNANKRDRVTAAIQQLNAALLALAQEKHLVLVDAFGMARAAWGTNSAPRTTLLLGNVAIQLRQSDTSSHTNPLAAFVDDGAHPHTTMQGVLANVIIEAFDEGYRSGVPLFSEQEILAHAGIAYGGQDTLAATIGPYSGYVHNFVCYANCDRSTATPVLNVADFTCFLQRYAAGDSYANCDGSTLPPVLNVGDFTCFLQQYAAGCP